MTSGYSENIGFEDALTDFGRLSEISTMPQGDLLWHAAGRFQARVRSARIGGLTLALVDESLPRLARINFGSERVFISYSSDPASGPLWDGVPLAEGSFALHAPGSCVHVRTHGWSRWGLISMRAEEYNAWRRCFQVSVVPLKASLSILTPERSKSEQVQVLHNELIRMALIEPSLLIHPGLARAAECDFLELLGDCLQAPVQEPVQPGPADLILLLHLAERCAQLGMSVPDVCRDLNVSYRQLDLCSRKLTQVSARTYLGLIAKCRSGI